jgi:ribosomal protein L37AE/L43A
MNSAIKTIEDIVCEKHSDAKFNKKRIFAIIGAYGDNDLDVYVCDSCDNDKKGVEDTVAYECKTCGIVLATPKVRQVFPEVVTVPHERPDPLDKIPRWEYYCKRCENTLVITRARGVDVYKYFKPPHYSLEA